jgi:hypothetical protein
MARATPTKEELSKAVIINVFTTVVGILIGMGIHNLWETHKTKQNALYRPSTSQIGDW